MECRDAVKIREASVLRLAGERPERDEGWLEAHLAVCSSCEEDVARLERAWAVLGESPAAVPSPSFLRTTGQLLAAETALRASPPLPSASPANVVSFRSRGERLASLFLRAAAIILAAGGGFVLARMISPAERASSREAYRIPVVAQRTLDVSEAMPDLSNRPRLANVAFRPADPAGRVGVSFDVTTRYTVVGRPDQKGIADLLVYLMSGAAETEGARGQAIDLVSQNTKAGVATAPEVVAVLADTLKRDRNPGVRKKAVEALVKLPPSEAMRDALILALRTDENPAVRIVAVEGLARIATSVKDATALDALRAKAGDEHENGYVRVQAAQALSRLEL
jgi:hypothetical protein